VKRILPRATRPISGTGAKAIEELKRQVGEIVAGKPVTKEVYPHQIAFNVLPQVDSFLPTGYTKEEMKMENEGRKIMHHRGVPRQCDLRARAGLSFALHRRERRI